MPRWGMVIDLDRCVACQACTAACQAENNVTFVGPEQSNAGRAIFWNEVLSEVRGEYPHVEVDFIPRPCMHCDNPLAASAESFCGPSFLGRASGRFTPPRSGLHNAVVREADNCRRRTATADWHGRVAHDNRRKTIRR